MHLNYTTGSSNHALVNVIRMVLLSAITSQNARQGITILLTHLDRLISSFALHHNHAINTVPTCSSGCQELCPLINFPSCWRPGSKQELPHNCKHQSLFLCCYIVYICLLVFCIAWAAVELSSIMKSGCGSAKSVHLASNTFFTLSHYAQKVAFTYLYKSVGDATKDYSWGFFVKCSRNIHDRIQHSELRKFGVWRGVGENHFGGWYSTMT